MPTISDLVSRAEQRVASAKRAADAARVAAEDAKDRAERAAAPAPGLAGADLAQREDRAAELSARHRHLDREHRQAVEMHRAAGRELASIKFERDLDAWVHRWHTESTHLVGDPEPALPWVDSTLVALADGDAYLTAALHLQRTGTAIPAGWCSPSTGKAL
jgi:hypothetical protein